MRTRDSGHFRVLHHGWCHDAHLEPLDCPRTGLATPGQARNRPGVGCHAVCVDRLAGVLSAHGQFCVPVWPRYLAGGGIGGIGLAHLHHLGSVPGHFPLQRPAGHGGGGARHAVVWSGL